MISGSICANPMRDVVIVCMILQIKTFVVSITAENTVCVKLVLPSAVKVKNIVRSDLNGNFKSEILRAYCALSRMWMSYGI